MAEHLKLFVSRAISSKEQYLFTSQEDSGAVLTRKQMFDAVARWLDLAINTMED